MGSQETEKREPFTYKSNSYFEKLPPCVVKTENLKRLFEILGESVREAAQLEISSLERPPDQAQEDFDKLKEYVQTLYVVSVVIIGSKGEYIQTDSPDVFETRQLPDTIDEIAFDTSFKYKALVPDRVPSNRIRV